jgi:hypothetical protein
MTFLEMLAQIEAETEEAPRYQQTMKMLMSKTIREEVGEYLTTFALDRPRDVLAVVMLALNASFILGPDPKDMVCRFEATQFYKPFVEAFRARTDPSMCVRRALDAFHVWKEGDKEDIRRFVQDQITHRRLHDEPYLMYLEKIYINAGGNAVLLSAFMDGPIRRRRTTTPTTTPENVTQMFHAVAESFDHPFMQDFIRLRAPQQGPPQATEPYLECLASLLSKFQDQPVEPTMESILHTFEH